MAQLQDIGDPVRVGRWLNRKNPKQFVATPNRPAVPRQASQRSRVVTFQFSLGRDEFDAMPADELWLYVDEMLNRIVDTVKEMRLRLNRKLFFYTFPTASNSTNRAVNTHEQDGLFIAWRAVYTGIPRSETTSQQVVDFEFSTEVGLVGNEKGSPHE